jgi:multidrug efflux pump subunit AcrA (membrane-fusion protein)
MKPNSMFAVALLISALPLWAGCQSTAPVAAPKPIGVHVATVSRMTLPDVLSLNGIVNPLPNQSAKVAAMVPGVLIRVGPQVGDWVHRNQEVAQLQQSIQDAQVQQAQAAYQMANANWLKAKTGSRPQEIAQAQASVQVANATLQNAQKNRIRMQKLLQDNIAAGKDVDLAISQERAALAQVQAAKASLSLFLKGPRREDRIAAKAQSNQAAAMLAQARANLNFTRITSPIDGIIAERYANIGDQAGPTTPIFLVVNPRVVLIQANMPVGYNAKVVVGQSVTILPPDQKQGVPGKVVSIGIKVDPVSSMVPVQISATNPKQILKIGMAVQASILLDEHRDTLIIPKACLISSSEKPDQYQVNRLVQGQSIPTLVKPGIMTQDQAEILSGLKAGDRVITDVGYELPEKTPVVIAK